MKIDGRWLCVLTIAAVAVFPSSNALSAPPSVREINTAMRKAADFMTNEVSTHGGYVFMYADDLSEQWGEIPARSSQIWVQPPGTPAVGMMLLEAFRATGDSVYLDYARRAANALIWGQRPEGGWHYLIDFDMPGLQRWYDDIASKCWGWEEYLHYYDNSSFDDESSTAPTDFLLELYMTTLDPTYRVPLLKALDFILDAQFPNGAWPQRYPLKDEFVHLGHPDYTAMYTFNDDVMGNAIRTLFTAWERLGDERYLAAAKRGMDFYIISQIAEPQAGWADQYDHDLKPCWARTFEPPAVSSIRTVRAIDDLEFFYKATGDIRYLKPIPAALRWLESSTINTDPSKTYYHPYFGKPRPYTHAYYYELGTNKPIYAHRSGTGVHDEKFWIDYSFENMYPYGPPFVLNVSAIRAEYERVVALSPEKARAEYALSKEREKTAVTSDKARALIDGLDSRGAWVTDALVSQYLSDAIGSPRIPRKVIDVKVYTDNMYALIRYREGLTAR